MKVKARYYEKINDRVHCYLCPHNCVIENGHYGKCNVRRHEDGELFSINYGEITSLSLDPIEKKPLSFFRPSSSILSAGSFGCNFKCGFCQNHTISQYVNKPNEGDDSQHKQISEYLPKEKLIELVLKTNNNTGIAFTYNEPGIWYEYVYDCAKLLKETAEDKAVVLVTNGYIGQEPLKQLLPYVDAMNIDLKSFNNDYYRRLCSGSLSPVLKTIEASAQSCHIEITTLLVSGENDRLEEVEQIAEYLSSISKDIPLHLSRYFPRYKLNNSPTDINFMRKAESVAKKHLNRVILGNI